MNAWILFLFWLCAFLALIPFLVRFFSKSRDAIEQRLIHRLEDFHIFVQPNVVRWVVVAVLIAAVTLNLLVFRSFWLLPFLVIGSLVCLFALVRVRLEKRFREIRYQLHGVVELVATSLRAGLSIRSALLQVSQQSPRPISQELAILERMQRIGIPLERALAEWVKRLPIEEVQLLGFTIQVSSASGGNLSESLDRLAGACRQRLILEEKVDALTAQGRLQAWVMVALPILLAIALSLIDSNAMEPLWITTTGHLVLGVIFVLELVGLLWIRRLIQIKD
jgi:tight adherence protein B